MKEKIMAIMVVFVLITTVVHAQDCTEWIGTWNVEYIDGTTTVWEIVMSEPELKPEKCRVYGVAEGDAYTGEFTIALISFDNGYYYKEEIPPTPQSPRTKLLISGNTFTVAPGGEHPILRGEKVVDEGDETGEEPDTLECPATAALGNDDPRLATIRKLRDEVLADNMLGSLLIELYYINAPLLTAAMKESPIFSETVKQFINAAVLFIEMCEQ